MPDVLEVASRMRDALTTDLNPKTGRLGVVKRYLDGDHDLPYVPQGASREFYSLAITSRQNWLPLVSDTYADSLHVEGYRADRTRDNALPWRYWQANGLDARQSIVHRGALEYGAAYVSVLPGEPTPVIKAHDPLRSYALYQSEDDLWPTYFLYRVGTSALGDTLWDLYDATSVYHLRVEKATSKFTQDGPAEEHGLEVCPVVRFRDRIDGRAQGIIAPLKADQDRVNELSFILQIALQYASFRQRWATGIAIPEKEILDEAGEVIGYEPIEPFEAAVDRLWTSDSTDTKFGEFGQTDTNGHLQALREAIRTLAARAQISPNVLMGDLVNLSADALAQMESATQRRLRGFERIFGEAWEQVLALAAVADGQTWDTTAAQVRWADTEARAFAATVDGLGKIAQMLQVPVEALWERIPGVSDTDVDLWRSLKEEADPLTVIAGEVARQTGVTPRGIAAPTA